MNIEFVTIIYIFMKIIKIKKPHPLIVSVQDEHPAF